MRCWMEVVLPAPAHQCHLQLPAKEADPQLRTGPSGRRFWWFLLLVNWLSPVQFQEGLKCSGIHYFFSLSSRPRIKKHKTPIALAISSSQIWSGASWLQKFHSIFWQLHAGVAVSWLKGRARQFGYYRCIWWAQQLINLEIPVLVQSPKTSNIDLG